MEVYNKKENPNLSPDQGVPINLPSAPNDDLSKEGIDLVGSGVREDNEFTSIENQESQNNLSVESKEPPTALVTPIVPTTLKSESQGPETVMPVASVAPITVPTAPTASTEPVVPVKNDPSIKPIRTFKTDAEEAVKYQKVSVAEIAIAEQKKKETAPVTPIEYTEPKEHHVGLFVSLVILIILALAGGWFYWFKSSINKEAVTSVRASIETIIPYAKGSTLPLPPENDPMILIGAKLTASNTRLEEVYALVPTLDPTSTQYADLTVVFGNTNMPSKLLRSLSGEYMVGAYRYDVNSPFIILKNTFFQNAFAGMLEWEIDMRNDLLPLIQVSYPVETNVTTNNDVFEDIVISNIDTRILRNSNGDIILAYAFVDTETLIITTNENALKYLLDRLLTVRSVQ